MNDAQHTRATAPPVREVPPGVRVALLHGYLQLVTEKHGLDILHLKGAAVHPQLRGNAERLSLDVDVLVRPDHVEPLLAALHDLGWHKVTGFEEGSAFAHATNLRHPLGLIDLHRCWPGIDLSATAAFEALWAEREQMRIADVLCSVPSLDDQRVVLLLHYARSMGHRDEDRRRAWVETDSTTRARVQARAVALHAEVAFAAAIGELEQFRGRREYRLWHYFSGGTEGRWEEWRGRFHAARGVGGKLRVLRALVSVNDDLLTAQLGHEPSPGEYVTAYRHRVHVAVADACRGIRSRVGGGRS